jgi:cytochrome b561
MRYDTKTIVLHWATAVIVPVLWIIGETDDFVPRGPLHRAYWSTHFLLGFILAAILLARIFWRSTGGKRLPAATGGVLHIVSQATHYLLYALLITVVALGIVNAFDRGVSIFGLLHLPQLGDPDWREGLSDLHGLAANALLAVAVFHAVAALAHHYLLRGRVLSRMLPAPTPHQGADAAVKGAVRQAP